MTGRQSEFKFVEMGRTAKLMIANDANHFTPVVMLFEKIFSLFARRISISKNFPSCNIERNGKRSE